MALTFIGIPAVGPAVVGWFSQFAAWNFAVGAVYVLSVGPAAYGAGKVAADEEGWGSLGALVAGLAVAAGCAVLAVRYHRRRQARAVTPAGNHADTGR